MKIIQHHKPIDFVPFFENVRRRVLDDPYICLYNLIHKNDEMHSFYGFSEGDNRIYEALQEIHASVEAKTILDRSDIIFIFILISPEAERPISMEEMGGLGTYINVNLSDKEINWTIIKDDSLGNLVETYILAGCKSN